MGRISRKKQELELAKRIASSLGMTCSVEPSMGYPPCGDEFVLEYRPNGGTVHRLCFTARRPVTGTEDEWCLADWKSRWFDDFPSARTALKPTWLSRDMTLEEIDLRLTAMGF